MTQFRKETGSTVPFYISYVFPLVGTDTDSERVKLPDQEFSKYETLEEQAPLVIEATFGDKDGEELLQADGIGFNCTSPLHSKQVTKILTSAYDSFVSSSSNPSSKSTQRPFFVLYPDGGAVYDVKTRTWSHPLGLTDEKWANLVVDAMQVAREGDVWSGVIGGGCCKAGVGAIAALRKEVEKRGWR
jgi:homocysteine S-methyltransferase